MSTYATLVQKTETSTETGMKKVRTIMHPISSYHGYGYRLPKQPTISSISFMVENGLAVTKRFDSDIFEYGQEITMSRTTYYGLIESLRTIDNCSIGSQIFVLCPRYLSKKCDTQACLGGKIPNDENGLKYENFVSAFRENLRNKMRVFCFGDPICLNETMISFKNDYQSSTKILAARASDCTTVFNFDTMNAQYSYNKSNQGRVGCVIWGTLNECMNLVGSIPCEEKMDIFVENIDAISIVPLSKAIEMALYASKFFYGRIIEQTCNM